MLNLRRLWPLLACIAALLALAGCGAATHLALPTTPVTCPAAASGHGYPGACAPPRLGLSLPQTVAGPKYPDRSNNDPCYCGAQIRAQGYVGLIVKANQGTGFIDGTAAGMIQSARKAGLAVGLYDFDQDYTVAEARVFVARARALGIYPTTPNTFPLYFDVEFGSFSYPGLLAQIAYVHSQGYRVGIYTGQWYWTPHAGCRWPQDVTAWLSGYPTAPVPCGTRGYNAHQFTATPIDLSIYLGSTASFHAFVHATPPTPPKPRLVCFGHGATPHARACQPILRLYAHQSGAAAATTRALHRNACRKPYRRQVCVSLGQRNRYFASHATATVRSYS